MNFKKFTIIAAIIILIIGLSAGVYYHFKDGTPVEIQTESQSTLPMAEAPDVTISQEHVTTEYVAPVEDVSVVVEPVVEVTPEPVADANWWDGRAGWSDAQVGTYSTLFDTDVDAVKMMVSDTQHYNLFDIEIEGKRLLNHQEYGAAGLNLDRELRDLYGDLERDYGSPVKVTKETDYVNNRVILEYIGSKDTFIHESDNIKKGTGRLIEDYLVSVPN